MKRFRLLSLLICVLIFCFSSGCSSDHDINIPILPKEDEPLKLSCFINHTWYKVNQFTGIIPDEITKQTGITLDITIAVDESQLSLQIASGNLNDLVYTATLVGRLSDPKLCYSYDEIMEEYDLSWDIPPELRLNVQPYSKDEKIYTLLNHYASTNDWEGVHGVPMIGSLLARQDILDTLGNPPINSFDDLMSVYGQVKQRYPDMIPLTFSTFHRFNCFRAWIGLGTTDFVPQADGSYILAIRDSRYQEMLSILNQMYQKGYLLADNFAAENTESGLPYRSGDSFSFLACTQDINIGVQASLSQINPAYNSVEMMPIEGAAQIVSDVGWSGSFITKSNPDPKRSLEFVKWMFSPEAQRLTQWGRESIDYTIDESGTPIFSEGIKQAIANGRYDTVYNPWFYFGGSAIVESIGRCAVLDWNKYKPTYDAIRENFENHPWIAVALPLDGTPERDIYDKILNSILSYESKVILSETTADFEKNFDEYMKSVISMNAALLERYVSKRIPEVKQSYQS